MKRISLVLISLLLWCSSVFAVEYISTNTDKSQIFRCEMHGSVFKVKVKYAGEGKYTVLVYGKSTAGFSGVIFADNIYEAARHGCGGE